MSMAQQIKQARIEKGYNQEYVAHTLGVSRQAVSKWETGQTQPDTKNLIALSDLLEVSVDQLLDKPICDTNSTSKKVVSLKRISALFAVCSILFGCIGFFSGIYSSMVFVPVSDNLSIGIPFLWYGNTFAAIEIKVTEILFLTLALLIRIIAWAINNKKQALV